MIYYQSGCDCLRTSSRANASWTEEATLLYQSIDISVAVAIDGGLITPIIKNAGAKGLQQISSEMKDLASRAREESCCRKNIKGEHFLYLILECMESRNSQQL